MFLGGEDSNTFFNGEEIMAMLVLCVLFVGVGGVMYFSVSIFLAGAETEVIACVCFDFGEKGDFLLFNEDLEGALWVFFFGDVAITPTTLRLMEASTVPAMFCAWQQ